MSTTTTIDFIIVELFKMTKKITATKQHDNNNDKTVVR